MWRLGGLAILLLATIAAADDAVDWRDRVVFSFSERLRGEFVDWFEPPAAAAARGAERYAFLASQMRGGVRVLYAPFELVVEVQDTRLAGLPGDAALSSSPGPLGPGALYVANSHDTEQGETFLKQGHLTLRYAGVTATAGRFEYRDGLETLPADGTLLALKRSRIAERLVGAFDFTHVTRSVDGVKLAYDRPAWNVTALAARPTAGGFEISANRSLDDVGLAGLAIGLKRLPIEIPVDARLFYFYYDDQRRDALKADNRALGARAADRDRLAIHTIGAHVVAAIDAGPGTIDLLAWGAAQSGAWGRLDHDAWAFAAEAGYQLPNTPWAPWLRVGLNRASGDDAPGDRTHRTFFQLLPTARTYALFPFYDAMNAEDWLAELLLRPHRLVAIKTDYHRVRLTEARDLWYAGGGAGNPDIFGYAGLPSNGRRDLAHVVSLSVTVTALPQVTLAGYYGHAFGGAVVRGSFAGTDADYGFVEATYRY